jgi:predicted RNase H-like HicB family nuclease
MSEMARILVIIEKGQSSYGAYSPDVPGCVAVADTREDVEHLMKEALETV